MSPTFSLRSFLKNRKAEKRVKPETQNGGNPGDDDLAPPVTSETPKCAAGTSATLGYVSRPGNSNIAAPVEPRPSEQVKPSIGSTSSLTTASSALHPTPVSTPTNNPAETDRSAASLPEQLWDRAYDSLRIDEPSLVAAYEKILSRKPDENDSASEASESQNIIAQADPAARRIQMYQFIQTGLKKTEREARIMYGVGAALQSVLSAKDMIDSAIQAVPQAALAWTGVCLTLQVSRRQETATVYTKLSLDSREPNERDRN